MIPHKDLNSKGNLNLRNKKWLTNERAIETVVLLSNTGKKKLYVTLDIDMVDYYHIKGEGTKTKRINPCEVGGRQKQEDYGKRACLSETVR